MTFSRRFLFSFFFFNSIFVLTFRCIYLELSLIDAICIPCTICMCVKYSNLPEKWIVFFPLLFFLWMRKTNTWKTRQRKKRKKKSFQTTLSDFEHASFLFFFFLLQSTFCIRVAIHLPLFPCLTSILCPHLFVYIRMSSVEYTC